MGIYSTYYNESSGAAYNAVLDVSFSEEDNIEPITREAAKVWARIDSVQDNIVIDQLIKGAREICEKFLNHSLINRTVTATINNSCGNIYLPYGPVISVTDVKNTNATVLEAGSYSLTGLNFKRLESPQEDNITISYKAGYECLPNGIKTGILCQIAYMYENKGDDPGNKPQLSPDAKGHLRPYKMK